MIVVLGGSGYLGSYIIDYVLKNSDENILATYNSAPTQIESEQIHWLKFDLAEQNSINCLCDEINITGINISKLIVLSAYHHPDKVKENPKLAYEINITNLDYLIRNLPGVDSLLYVSSDVVYGQSTNNHLFKESEKTNPVNLYGKQKALAEDIILRAGYNVARCSFLIGPSLSYKKHFYDQIVLTLSSGREIEMLCDSCRSAISFEQASKYLVDLMDFCQNGQMGIVNIASDEILSKYEIAKRIAHKHKLNEKLIIPVGFKDNNFFSEERAKDILMDNSKLKNLLNISSLKLEI